MSFPSSNPREFAEVAGIWPIFGTAAASAATKRRNLEFKLAKIQQLAWNFPSGTAKSGDLIEISRASKKWQNNRNFFPGGYRQDATLGRGRGPHAHAEAARIARVPGRLGGSLAAAMVDARRVFLLGKEPLAS